MATKEEGEGIFEIWLGDSRAAGAPSPLSDALDSLYASGPGSRRTQQVLVGVRASIRQPEADRLYYASLDDTPVGRLFIAQSGKGIVALEYSESETAFVSGLIRRVGGKPERSPGRLKDAARQVMEYLEGRRETFDLPLDLAGLTPFQQRVLLAVAHVPRGKVATYAEIARSIDRPKAARAVGQALRRNPIPIVIPCHRVLASNGGLGGYTGRGGVRTKRQLLSLEGVELGTVA
ncbi:MAG TPA: methylated-DNA--[protein]-cysteine S-methyltransferase [Anaerolineales bacterium]|nr:methylated-DNA--[protein]-cysteine S-methyltransferase [Anaerolineales bacterium]